MVRFADLASIVQVVPSLWGPLSSYRVMAGDVTSVPRLLLSCSSSFSWMSNAIVFACSGSLLFGDCIKSNRYASLASICSLAQDGRRHLISDSCIAFFCCSILRRTTELMPRDLKAVDVTLPAVVVKFSFNLISTSFSFSFSGVLPLSFNENIDMSLFLCICIFKGDFADFSALCFRVGLDLLF